MSVSKLEIIVFKIVASWADIAGDIILVSSHVVKRDFDDAIFNIVLLIGIFTSS